jgi:hypothetical protein
VRQPGHAAMTRWTSNGWDVCLGGGMWKSWWNDQGGLDFLLETQARVACANERTFLQKVYRLQWLAQYYYNEKTDAVRRNGTYDPNNPWYTLSMIQRQQIVKNTKVTNKLMFPTICGGKNQLERMFVHQMKVVKSDIEYNDATGVIVIPATSCLPNNKAMMVPSFSGGQQLFVKEDAEVEYEINLPLLMQHHPSYNASSKVTLLYSVTCCVATAHRSEQSITLSVNDTRHYNISMPYTMALWDTTTPINITIEVVDQPTVTLKLKRAQQNFGFAFKEISLSPL